MIDKQIVDKNRQCLTAGHTQLPDPGVAKVGSFGYLSGNPTRKRLETATAHTGKRWRSLKKKTVEVTTSVQFLIINVPKK
ncbi:MAG TPA: hypothetical protein GXZ70_07770 [Clostridiales bacterium]|nr:hypothetical protein [Clostridiales bacterium]